MAIAIDTGGTFTDVVARVDGAIRRFKVPSTPDDPAEAVRAALARLPAGSVRHGTTVGTNAVLERRTARVTLITNSGFEDILHLARQTRPDLYALHPVKPPPLTLDVVGVPVRRGADGTVLDPLPDLQKWLAARPELATAEAFAVCLLHADLFPADEVAIGAALRGAYPDTPITLSSRLSPVFREYERAATTTLNAALQPVMTRYLARLEAAAPGLLVMGSGGGLMPASMACEAPAHTVVSGPAGGVRGAWTVAQRNGVEGILAVDMGGTSTDVSVVQGALLPEDDGTFHGHPLRVPLLPIETVGAGGGSIAWVDAGGMLQVGPRSAGAAPGPACYGRGGTAATVTDAHVVLGRLEALLGGEMALDQAAARVAIQGVAEALGVDVQAAAHRIVDVATANMARAAKAVSLHRGIDPATLTLVPFGGAGGLHACALADALGCDRLLVPRAPGVLSAEGILGAPIQTHATLSVCAPLPVADLAQRIPALGAGAVTVLADARYVGQTFTLAVDVSDDLDAIDERFQALHQRRYGYALDRVVELVAVRIICTEATAIETASAGRAGDEIVGPQAIASYGSTLWLAEGWAARRTPTGDTECFRTTAAKAGDGALAVHKAQLGSVADEMGATLMRAAFSANIKERRDFSCAIFDAAGQMLVHAAHIPVHLGSTPASVRAAIDSGLLAEGSVVLNDPFHGGTHLPDVTLVTPVVIDGEAAFYVANRAHHADVGGDAPGSFPAPRDDQGRPRALTIEDEGICLPPTVLDSATRDRFAQASRLPAERLGDLRAQEAANHVGAKRVMEWVARHGLDAVNARNQALLDYAEARMRALIRGLPDGTWQATEWLDDDGLGDSPVALPVRLVVSGETLTVDFRAVPPQTAGPLNAVRAIVDSAVFYCLRCLDAGLPANAGLMRPVTVLTTPGSILDARAPAAVSAGNVETSQRLVDVVFAALAQASDRIPAASCGSMNNVLFGGEVGGAPFVHYETLAGGSGGGPAGPGADAIHTHMTNTLNTPIEALERTFPVRIERYALAPNYAEGGSRGGRGVVRRYRFLAPATVTLVAERRRVPASGRNGASGPLGSHTLIRHGGALESLGGKVVVHVEAGEAIEVTTPGGGAYNP